MGADAMMINLKWHGWVANTQNGPLYDIRIPTASIALTTHASKYYETKRHMFIIEAAAGHMSCSVIVT